MQRVTQYEPWAKIPHWVVMHPDLDATAIRVYCILSKHANKARNSFPGIRTVANEAHCAKSTVQRSLDALEELGAITVRRTFRGKRHLVNQYHLPMSPFGVLDGPTIGTRMGRLSVQGGSVIGTPDGPTIGTELEVKNQLTRELENSKPEILPRLPGESKVAHMKRIAEGI